MGNEEKKSCWSCELRVKLSLIITILLVGVVESILGIVILLKLDSYSLISSSTAAPTVAADTFKTAAVAADASQCSRVGVEILKKDGSAVDAAIASLLCVGVINMHSTGIGGGGYLVYYNATSKKATVIDYRETAPARAVYTDDKYGEMEKVAAASYTYFPCWWRLEDFLMLQLRVFD